jgi:hypothetical protein
MSGSENLRNLEELLTLANIPVAWRTPRKRLYCHNQNGRLVPVSKKSREIKIHTVSVIPRPRTRVKRRRRIRILTCLNMNSKLLARVAELMKEDNVFLIKMKK